MARVKQKGRTSKALSSKLDRELMGSEPLWEGVADRVTYLDAMNYYNYMHDVKEGRKWVQEYLKNQKASPAKVRGFNALADTDVPMTVCSVCRILNRDLEIADSSREYLDKRLGALLEAGKKKVASRRSTAKVEADRPSPAEIVKENTRDFIGEIEQVLDDWEANEDFDLYGKMKIENVPYVTAKAVADYYGELRDEIDLLIKKKDADLEEGYSFMKPTKKKKYLAFIKALISDAESYMTGKKSQRKPRKRKVKTDDDQIKNLKFKKEDADLKISSVDPRKIVGASELYVYNIRYKSVGYYKALTDRGLSVKGTTIQDFDPEASYKKRIRVPEEFLSQLVSAPKVRSRKLLKDQKLKAADITGRINDDTILLKVIK